MNFQLFGILLLLNSVPTRQYFYKKSLKNSRIINGHTANLGDWKFAVALVNEDIGIFCGGSLITINLVLTAAHCLNANPFQIKIITGNVDLYESSKRDIYNVKMAIVHEYYEEKHFHNDIAILKLNKNITRSFTVNLVTLPEEWMETESSSLAKSNCFVMGWGKTETGYSSDVLYDLKLPIIDDIECKRRTNEFDSRTQLCAGFIEGQKDSCQGDSGGPLVCETLKSNGKYHFVQYGIVSFGEGCAAKGRPGYYTRVSGQLDWIKRKINLLDNVK